MILPPFLLELMGPLTGNRFVGKLFLWDKAFISLLIVFPYLENHYSDAEIDGQEKR